jgi:hypothetical protein
MTKPTIMKIAARSFLAICLIAALFASQGAKPALAACTAPGTDYGAAATSLTAPTTATYRIWTRMMVPDTSNKTYLLELDGGSCFNVGGGSFTANTWTWVDYYNGNGSTKVQQSLSQGSHNIKLIGNAPGVKVDRVLAVSDLNCVPTGLGDNCNVPSDTTAPTVNVTSPTQGALASGNVNITASSTDNVGVTKVEFYDNSTLLSSDTTSPYAMTWNSATATNGSHLITAKAYDASGNTNTDAVTVIVQNGDTQPPSTPANVTATATSYQAVNVTWSSSTDNVGVTGYTVLRDSVPVATLGKVNSYADSGLAANTTYAYQVQTVDAAGNKSGASPKVTATTQKVADPVAPTAPTAPTATSTSPTQVNLQWQPATDNIGVVGYDVYRTCGSGPREKIGTSPTSSYGDPNATSGTDCTYEVVARDASGNSSPQTQVKVSTPKLNSTVPGVVGKITDRATSKAIRYARAVVKVDKNRHIYQADVFGRYAIFNLGKGNYNIAFSYSGYSTHISSVQIDSGRLVRNVVLQKR